MLGIDNNFWGVAIRPQRVIRCILRILFSHNSTGNKERKGSTGSSYITRKNSLAQVTKGNEKKLTCRPDIRTLFKWLAAFYLQNKTQKSDPARDVFDS